MNYRQAEEYLNSFVNYEQIPGISYAQPGYSLRHVEELLNRMGNPQLTARTIHIAGTKGKGSVAAMIAEVLSSSGYKTGRYTSPHFHTLRERITIDGSLISEAEFAAAMAHVKPFIESMKQDASFRQLTYFEALTALTFAYFQKKLVDFQVLEVGLGGRLDATNVVANPAACVITSISLDHTQILGNTLEEIAREKAGIIKSGCWAVISPQPQEAASVISDICREKKAKVLQVGRDVTWHKIGGDLRSQSLVIQGKTGIYQLTIPLLGDFQLENAATAVAALEVLAFQGFAISAVDIAQGLARVQWPGRFQILQQQPAVVIDGAHNVVSMKRLVSNIKAYFPEKRIFLVFGTSCDKDIPGMINELVSLSPQVIVTQTSHSRAAPLSTLVAEFTKRGVEPGARRTVAEAISRALSLAGRTDVICVTGSLFVVAEALDYFSGS
ncbi:MAG: bifunctional folylpolyglutamate synthase/dihydrofolate synthase [Dehalococcoidia bacterium]|nr:bifunctional folylpolyglutamate synthase/dihydrofolate synthase [Dehalococcoidia bacterium]MDH4299286.1 bifunctional folylpolyglutamate synthase/dihydrofolate synthase [Dehalococcoidia bacterium]MDH4366743.1 bifunctional folylpolyglutamate synthase/dihydrofolate synthase [Dehalococcoidia bacterium]